MTELEFEAISMLEAWVRDFGDQKEPVFITHLGTVLAMAKRGSESQGTLDILPWCTETGQNACSCHERDSSVVCPYCRSQGYRGHMERTVTQ